MSVVGRGLCALPQIYTGKKAPPHLNPPPLRGEEKEQRNWGTVPQFWGCPHATAIVIVIGFLLSLTSAFAQPTSSTKPRAIVFVLDSATWQELRGAQYPNFSNFLDSSAVGLMNTKGPRDRDPASVWATLGAGRGAAAGLRHLGLSPERRGELGPARAWKVYEVMQAGNQRRFTQARPGLLGEVLSVDGIDRTLIRLNTMFDMSPALVADTKGEIPAALTLSRDDPQTNAAIMETISRRSGFIVIDWTLPQNLDVRSYPSTDPLAAARAEVLRQADLLLGRIVDGYGNSSLIILLSPSCPEYSNPYVRNLAPIIIHGGGFPAGLLASPSTRRRGMVSNVDFAPTILGYFHLPVPAEMTGRAMRVLSSPTPLKELGAFDRRAATAYRLQLEAGPILGIVGGILIILSILLIAFPSRLTVFNHKYSPTLLLTAAAFPLAMLLVAPLQVSEAYVNAAVTLIVAALLALISVQSGSFPRPLGAICLVTAVVMLADMLLGTPLLSRSVMCSELIVSGRFYGLGNHEAGVFIGALVLAGGAALNSGLERSRRRRRLVFGAMALGVLFLGAPFGGANLGQGLGGAVALLAFWILLSPTGCNRRLVGAVLLFLAAGGLFVAVDLLMPREQQSHLAGLVHMVEAQGLSGLAAVMRRKLLLAVDISLYNFAVPLSLPLFAVVTALPLRPVGRLRGVMARNGALARSLSACGVGAIAASLLNDSGLVAGIALISLPVLGLLYFALEATRESIGS